MTGSAHQIWNVAWPSADLLLLLSVCPGTGPYLTGCLAQRKLLQPAAENQGLAGALQDAIQNSGIPALTQQVEGLAGGNSVPLAGAAGAAAGDTPPTAGSVLEGLRDQVLGVQQQVQNAAGLQAQNAGTRAGDVLGELR